MKDEACIFCKIANGEIPSKTLYEDEKYRVILDLGPAARGHALILPKDHYANLYELEKYNKRPAAGIILSQEVFPVSKSAASGCKILSCLFSLVHMFFCNSIQQFCNRLGGVHLLALTHGINISLTVKIKFLYLLNQKIGA